MHKLHERERKAKWRADKKAKHSGTYQETPLEVAKSLLEEMDSPDLQTMLNSNEIRESLTSDDLKLL